MIVIFLHLLLDFIINNATLSYGQKRNRKNTFSYYDNNAKEFTAFKGEGVSRYWSKELAHFQEFLQKGTILEVGCGVGNEAFILKEIGYQYVGIDNSLGMFGIAKNVCPKEILLVKIFVHWDFLSSLMG